MLGSRGSERTACYSVTLFVCCRCLKRSSSSPLPGPLFLLKQSLRVRWPENCPIPGGAKEVWRNAMIRHWQKKECHSACVCSGWRVVVITTSLGGGGNSNICLEVSSRKLGKMNPFWLIFFEMGWFNHQLAINLPLCYLSWSDLKSTKVTICFWYLFSYLRLYDNHTNC